MSVVSIRIKRSATRAALDAAAAVGKLVQGEPYLIADEGRFAVGLSATTYAAMAKQGEGGGGTTDDTLSYVTLDYPTFSAWLSQSVDNQTKLANWLSSPTGITPNIGNATVQSNLTTSAVALGLVIASPIAVSAFASDAAAWSKLTGSTALTATSIPAMTSATTPSGSVSASSYNGAYVPYQAFDRTANLWIASGTDMTNQWIRYDFPAAVYLHTGEVTPGSLGGPTSFRIEYSDNATTWTTAVTVSSYSPAAGVKTTHKLLAAGRHRYWRLFSMTSTGFGSINELQLRGFA